MSVKQTHLLRQQIGAGDHVKATETAKLFQRNPNISFDEFIQEVHYAVNVRQPDIALILLAEFPRFFESIKDADKTGKADRSTDCAACFLPA